MRKAQVEGVPLFQDVHHIGSAHRMPSNFWHQKPVHDSDILKNTPHSPASPEKKQPFLESHFGDPFPFREELAPSFRKAP